MTFPTRLPGGLYALGILLHVPAALALSTFAIGLVTGERQVALPFLWTGAGLVVLAQALLRGFVAAEETRPSEAMALAAIAWLVVPATAVVPLVMVGHAAAAHGGEAAAVFAHPMNAFSVAAVVRERRLGAYWKDGQHRLFWILLPALVGATVVVSRVDRGAWLPLESAFQAVSALCTAGFQTADFRAWSVPGQLLLVVAMVVGGAAGSTAGGLKMRRVYLMAKGIAWRHRSLRLDEHELLRHDLDGEGVAPRRAIALVESAAILGVLWAGVHVLGTLALLLVLPASTPLEAVVLEVASAESNVGLSSGLTSAALPLTAKAILIGIMWVGRLEILPVFVLVTSLARLRPWPGRASRRAPPSDRARRWPRGARPRDARSR